MRLDSQRVENTLYFYKVTGWTAADVPVVFNALLVWWNTYYSVPVSNQLSLNEIKVTDLSSDVGFSFEIPTPTPKPTGDSAEPAAPNNVALCISFRTASRGRSSRGRNYVPGIPKTAITANTAPIETLELPCSREPIHSASRGLPVQMLIATTAIAARIRVRLRLSAIAPRKVSRPPASN